MVTRILSYDEKFWQRVQDWKTFDFDAIRREARRMYDEHNFNGVRVGPVMAQDSLDYWIAVATWNRAKRGALT